MLEIENINESQDERLNRLDWVNIWDNLLDTE